MSRHEQDQTDDSPVYPPLTNCMKVDFVFNGKGDVWLLHNKPLPELLKWIEYDQDMETVILAAQSGKIQPLGVKIPAEKGYRLQQAQKVTVIYMKDGKIADFTIVPVVARSTNAIN